VGTEFNVLVLTRYLMGLPRRELVSMLTDILVVGRYPDLPTVEEMLATPLNIERLERDKVVTEALMDGVRKVFATYPLVTLKELRSLLRCSRRQLWDVVEHPEAPHVLGMGWKVLSNMLQHERVSQILDVAMCTHLLGLFVRYGVGRYRLRDAHPSISHILRSDSHYHAVLLRHQDVLSNLGVPPLNYGDIRKCPWTECPVHECAMDMPLYTYGDVLIAAGVRELLPHWQYHLDEPLPHTLKFKRFVMKVGGFSHSVLTMSYVRWSATIRSESLECPSGH
jgi:hypothetical protein